MNSQPTVPIPLPDQPDPLVRIVQFAYEIGALRTDSGRLLFDEIVSGKVNPWDWFLQGPGTYGK